MAALTMNRMIEQAKEKAGMRRKLTAVDWVANAMPWAGSAIPAVMTYKNVQKLGFLPWQALVIGAVVEGMGLVSITTALDIYEANRAERTINPSRPLLDGPFWVATAGAAVYLGAVLMVNAILDGGTPGEKLTLALLSLFGVIGGIMVALRNQLAKRVTENEQASVERSQEAEQARAASEAQAREELEYRRGLEREALENQRRMDEERLRLEHEEKLRKIEADTLRKLEKIKAESIRKAPESDRKVSGETPEVSGELPEASAEAPESHRRWSDIPVSEYEWIAEAPASAIVKKYKLAGKDPERLARTWKVYAKKGLEATND